MKKSSIIGIVLIVEVILSICGYIVYDKILSIKNIDDSDKDIVHENNKDVENNVEDNNRDVENDVKDNTEIVSYDVDSNSNIYIEWLNELLKIIGIDTTNNDGRCYEYSVAGFLSELKEENINDISNSDMRLILFHNAREDGKFISVDNNECIKDSELDIQVAGSCTKISKNYLSEISKNYDFKLSVEELFSDFIADDEFYYTMLEMSGCGGSAKKHIITSWYGDIDKKYGSEYITIKNVVELYYSESNEKKYVKTKYFVFKKNDETSYYLYKKYNNICKYSQEIIEKVALNYFIKEESVSGDVAPNGEKYYASSVVSDYDDTKYFVPIRHYYSGHLTLDSDYIIDCNTLIGTMSGYTINFWEYYN